MSTQALAHPGISPRHPLKLAGVLIATAAAVVLFALMLVASLLGSGAVSLGSAPDSFGVSALAEAEIPPLYLSLYEQAARHYGLDWTILAGIGKVECDHGRDPDPSCTKEGAVNSAGAGGPAQFLARPGPSMEWMPTARDHRTAGIRPMRFTGWRTICVPRELLRIIARRSMPTTTRGGMSNEVEHWASLYRGPTQPGRGNRPLKRP